MKSLKMLGLAAIAAGALLAIAGSGTASATVLCENTPAAGTDCSSKVLAGTVVDFSLEPGTSTLLKGPFGETIGTCTESTISGPTSNTGGPTETVKTSLSTFTFASCNHPTTVKAKGTLEFHHIAGTDNGTVTSTGATVIIDETLFGACQYATNATTLGTMTGKTITKGAPTIDLNAKITSENGCPQASLSGSYIYTGGTNFDVATGAAPSASVLCEVIPAAETDCSATNHVKAGTPLDFSLEPGTSALLKGPFGETIATCTESTAKGETTTTGGTSEAVIGQLDETKDATGDPVGLTFGSCNHPVTVKTAGKLEIHHRATTNNGTVTSTGATVVISETMFGAPCQYKTEATSIGTLTGKTASAPTFDINAKINSENSCPQGSWSGSYVYTGTTNFVVAAG